MVSKKILVFAVFLMLAPAAFALTATYSKNGNALSSGSGQYATNSHCGGTVCGWVSGNQIILGVYGDPISFNGGAATWSFSVAQPLNSIQSALLTVSWPTLQGKGLHSVSGSGGGTVSVNGGNIASPSVNCANKCHPSNPDCYAYSCGDFSAIYNVPVNQIGSTTDVTISAGSSNLWDIATVTLTITYSSGGVCSKNSDCGTDGWVNSPSCSNNDVYQNYKTYICNNPGTPSSSCTSSTASKLKQDCGDTTYELWSAPYCNGKIVEKSRTVHNKGCSSGACTAADTTEKQTVQTCQYSCTNGVCTGQPACSTNSDCGTDGYTDSPFCQSGNVYQNYVTYTCSNPGNTNAACTNNKAAKLKQTCSSGCSGGICQGGGQTPLPPTTLLLYEPFESTQPSGWSITGSASSTTGKVQNAVDFARGSRAAYPANVNSNAGTIEFWFKPHFYVGSGETGTGLFEIGEIGQPNSIALFILPYKTGNVVAMEMRDASNKLTQSWTRALKVDPEKWHHAVLTWKCNQNSNYMKIIYDGKSGSSNSGACSSLSLPGNLKVAGVSGYYNDGSEAIDDLRVYNYVRTSQQIAGDYNHPNTPPA